MSSHSVSAQSGETKSTRFWRNFLAFILFMLIFVLSISCCAKVSFFSQKNISQIFTNVNYIDGYYDDILQYAHDACDEAGIPTDSVDSVITQNAVSEIAYAYGEGNFTKSEQYDDESYQNKIAEIKLNIAAETQAMIDSYDLEISESQKKYGINNFAEKIANYITQKTEFAYADDIKKVVNIGNAASVVIIVISVILTLIVGLIIFSIGTRKYRNIRAIAYSFIASSMLDLLMVFAYAIVNATKEIYIFPKYLCNSVMAYINTCVYSVLGAAVLTIVAEFVVITIVWKLKHDRK